MKRATQLQPLSRQHHLGLNLSRHAKECSDNPHEISKHWNLLLSYLHDMYSHFQLEDNLLVSALLSYQSTDSTIVSTLNKLEEQHKLLHTLTAEYQPSQHADSDSISTDNISAKQVRQLATVLYDHIRFEERELFPAAEQHLTEDELDAIYKVSPAYVKRSNEQR